MRFDDVPDHIVSTYAEHLGVQPPAGGELRDAVHAALADGERVARVLAGLPVLSLLALEAMAEAGGGRPLADVCDLVQARSGADPTAVLAAIERSNLHGLSACVSTSRPADERRVCLVEPAAAQVAARVRGLSLPSPPPDPADDSEDRAPAPEGLRELLALAGLTAHHRIPFTSELLPHRTQLGKVARALGVDRDRLVCLFHDVGRWRLLGGDDRARLWPRVDRMRAAARGELTCTWPPGSVAEYAATHLPAEGWCSAEAIARAYAAAGPPSRPRPLPRAVLERARDVLGSVDAFDRRRVDGELWLRRRRSPAEVRRGDGEVTPRFQVTLGPEVDLRVLVAVTLAAELVRFEPALAFRLTPESVAAARALGLALDEVLEALRAVGPGGLPDAVEQSVRRWYGAARVARVFEGWAVELPRGTAHAVRDALGADVLTSPAPGWLLVDRAARDGLDRILDGHGVRVCEVLPLVEAAYHRDRRKQSRLFYRDPLERAAPHSAPLGCEADPALRARWERARADGLLRETGGVQPRPPDVEDPPDPVAELRARVVRDGADGREDRAEVWRRLLALHERLRPEIDDWALRLGAEGEPERGLLLAEPLYAAPLFVLPAAARREILLRARSAAEVVSASVRAITEGRAEITTEGLELTVSMVCAGIRPERPQPAPQRLLPGRASLRARLEDACEHGTPVCVKLRGRDDTLLITPRRLHRRGDDEALIAVDTDTRQDRVIPLAMIESLLTA